MTREQQWVILFLSLSLSCFFFLSSPYPPLSQGRGLVGAGVSPSPKPLQSEFRVEVDGSVKHRGIYSIEVGTPLLDVLEKAGGLNEKLTLSPENLLIQLGESCRLNIVTAGDGKARVLVEPLAPQKQKVLSLPIHLNTATVEELDTLPGIGPKIAQTVIEHRQKYGKFTSPQELLQVPGIGPKKLAAILPHIIVQEEANP